MDDKVRLRHREGHLSIQVVSLLGILWKLRSYNATVCPTKCESSN